MGHLWDTSDGLLVNMELAQALTRKRRIRGGHQSFCSKLIATVRRIFEDIALPGRMHILSVEDQEQLVDMKRTLEQKTALLERLDEEILDWWVIFPKA